LNIEVKTVQGTLIICLSTVNRQPSTIDYQLLLKEVADDWTAER